MLYRMAGGALVARPAIVLLNDGRLDNAQFRQWLLEVPAAHRSR